MKTDGYADAVHREVATRSEGRLLIVRPVTTGPPWMHACGAKFQPLVWRHVTEKRLTAESDHGDMTCIKINLS